MAEKAPFSFTNNCCEVSVNNSGGNNCNNGTGCCICTKYCELKKDSKSFNGKATHTMLVKMRIFNWPGGPA